MFLLFTQIYEQNNYVKQILENKLHILIDGSDEYQNLIMDGLNRHYIQEK